MRFGIDTRWTGNVLAGAGLGFAGVWLALGALLPGRAAAACHDYSQGQGGGVVPVEVSVLPLGELESFGPSGDQVWLVSSVYGGLVGFDISNPL